MASVKSGFMTARSDNESSGFLSMGSSDYDVMSEDDLDHYDNMSSTDLDGTPRHQKKKKKSKSLSKRLKKGLGGGVSKLSCTPRKSLQHDNPTRPGLDQVSYETGGDSGSCASSLGGANNKSTTEEAGGATTPTGDAINYPIPLHTQALIVALSAFFFKHLPTLKSLDEVANINTFTNVLFPSVVPLAAVIMVRLACSAIMLGNAASVFLYGEWYADTDYLPGSKLTVAKRIPFRGAFHPEGNLWSGLRCISTFTLWCWIVEGTAFFLAAMIPLFHFVPGTTVNPWIMRLAMVLWETAAPVSILVSAVVKYALWPIAMEHGENVKLLKAPGALLQHNLNSIAALVEVGLLGGMPVRMSDFAFPPLYGILYLLFTYFMMSRWGHDHKKLGPQFVYPFFDTTLGLMTSLALVILLAVLSLSFVIFCGMEHVLAEADKFIAIVPAAAIVLLALSVCRVKD